MRIRIHLQLAARQRGDAGEGERQLVLEERAAETAHRRAKPGAPALQIILLGRCHDVEAQAELPRKRLLVACHHIGLPPGRMHRDLRTLQVGVRDAAVEVEACLGAGVPVEVGIQTRLLALDDIPVGRVQQILVVVEAILRDTVSGEALPEGEVEHPLRRVVIINQIQVVHFLAIQIRVAIGQRRRVGLIHIRIQVGDARPADAHIISQAEVLPLVEPEGEIGAGHQIPIIEPEILRQAEARLHVLPRMLVTHSGGQRKAAHLSLIFGVGRKDVILMLVVQAIRLVPDLLLAEDIVIVRPRGIVAQDVFQPCIQLLPLR